MHREPFFVQEVKLFSACCQAAVKRHGNEGLSESLRGSPTARVGVGTQAVGHAGCGVERRWWCGAHFGVILFLETDPQSEVFTSMDTEWSQMLMVITPLQGWSPWVGE